MLHRVIGSVQILHILGGHLRLTAFSLGHANDAPCLPERKFPILDRQSEAAVAHDLVLDFSDKPVEHGVPSFAGMAHDIGEARGTSISDRK